MAMELHFSKQEAMPDLEEAVGDVAMETSSCPSSLPCPDISRVSQQACSLFDGCLPSLLQMAYSRLSLTCGAWA